MKPRYKKDEGGVEGWGDDGPDSLNTDGLGVCWPVGSSGEMSEFSIVG